MKSQEKLLRMYCAHVLIKYGFEFSPHDPIVPALYTISKELGANKIGNEAVAKSIKDALEKLNPTVYNFNERGEAWDFKLAESLRWFFAGLSVVTIFLIGLVWWKQYHDVQKAEDILKTSSEIKKILLDAKKDENDFIYWEFSQAKGKFILNGKEYVQVSQDTVRVYLGKSD